MRKMNNFFGWEPQQQTNEVRSEQKMRFYIRLYIKRQRHQSGTKWNFSTEKDKMKGV